MTVSIISFNYDPLDRCIACARSGKPVSSRFYQKDHWVTAIQGNVATSLLRNNHQALAQLDPTETSLLTTDLPGSAISLVKPRHPVNNVIYSPYGYSRSLDSAGALVGFNGELPEALTGHYLLGNGHRVYNPVLMRFNSPDSLSPFEGGDINAYAYCSGDPLNREDSTGHMWLSTFKRMVELNGAARATAIVRPLHHSSVGASGLRVTPARNELQAHRVMRPLPERVEGATTLNDVPVALVRPVQRQESQRVASQRSFNSTPTLNSGHSTPSSSSRDSTPPGSPPPRARRRTDVVVNVTNMETGARSVRFIRDPDAAP